MENAPKQESKSSTPPPPPAPKPAAAQPPLTEADKKDIEEHKVLACIVYIGILFLVPLLAAKQSKFAQYHAKQGLLLFAVEMVISMLLRFSVLGNLLNLVLVVISAIAIYETYQGKYWELPLVGQYAKKINF